VGFTGVSDMAIFDRWLLGGSACLEPKGKG